MVSKLAWTGIIKRNLFPTALSFHSYGQDVSLLLINTTKKCHSIAEDSSSKLCTPATIMFKTFTSIQLKYASSIGTKSYLSLSIKSSNPSILSLWKPSIPSGIPTSLNSWLRCLDLSSSLVLQEQVRVFSFRGSIMLRWCLHQPHLIWSCSCRSKAN